MLYFVLLHSSSSDSIHTGAPYNRRGRIDPLYTVYRASWLSPQLCFTNSHRVCINFVQFPDMCCQKYSKIFNFVNVF